MLVTSLFPFRFFLSSACCFHRHEKIDSPKKKNEPAEGEREEKLRWKFSFSVKGKNGEEKKKQIDRCPVRSPFSPSQQPAPDRSILLSTIVRKWMPSHFMVGSVIDIEKKSRGREKKRDLMLETWNADPKCKAKKKSLDIFR